MHWQTEVGGLTIGGLTIPFFRYLDCEKFGESLLAWTVDDRNNVEYDA